MGMKEQEIKSVGLPDKVTISVRQLHKLREDSAMLAALKSAKVEDWHGWQLAKFFLANDPDLIDIKLGWKE